MARSSRDSSLASGPVSVSGQLLDPVPGPVLVSGPVPVEVKVPGTVPSPVSSPTSGSSTSPTPDRPYRTHLHTIEEVTNGYEFLSDHLPLICTVEGSTLSGETKEVKDFHKRVIITWNLHAKTEGFDDSSGFAANSESKEQFIARKHRITCSLIEMIKLHKPDLILLQEVGDYELEFKNLPHGYTAIRSPDPRRDKGLCTIYKSELGTPDCVLLPEPKYKPRKDRTKEEEKHYLDAHYRAVTQHLIFEKFEVFNVHWPHKDMPHEAAEQLLMRLEGLGVKKMRYVGGDFNNRICEDKPYLVNGVTNPVFRVTILGQAIQGVDWTDGVFYRDQLGKCQLAKSESLHPKSGEVYKETPPTLKGLQKIELERQRLCLTVTADEIKALHAVFPPKVISYLNSLGIYVGRSVNAFGRIQPALYCEQLNAKSSALIKEFMRLNELNFEAFTVKELKEEGCLLPIPVENCRINPTVFFVLSLVQHIFNEECEAYDKIVAQRFFQWQDRTRPQLISETREFLYLLFKEATQLESVMRRNDLFFNIKALIAYLERKLDKKVVGALSSGSEVRKIYQKMLDTIPEDLKKSSPSTALSTASTSSSSTSSTSSAPGPKDPKSPKDSKEAKDTTPALLTHGTFTTSSSTSTGSTESGLSQDASTLSAPAAVELSALPKM